MRLIFLDTETTGLGPTDRLCQIAYTVVESGKVAQHTEALYKPPVPISIEAMATHHITEKMVAGKPQFAGSFEHADLIAMLALPDTYLVAHHAAFDVEMLRREGVHPKRVICTLKLARHLDQQGEIASHRLQYLRYLWDLPVEGARAHDASGDVHVLRALFHYLQSAISGMFPTMVSLLNEMVRISAQPSLLHRFHFGKYRGERMADIAKNDPDYLQWLYRSESQKEKPDADLLYSLVRWYPQLECGIPPVPDTIEK